MTEEQKQEPEQGIGQKERQEKGLIGKVLGNKWTKRALITGAAIATGFGTFSSNDGSYPPIYVNKTGTSGGIAAGLYVHVDEEANFYGVVVSPFTTIDGNLNGTNVNLFDLFSRGTVNGLEAGLIDVQRESKGQNEKWRIEKRLNGADIGIVNSAYNVNGFRLGLFNLSRHGNYADLGVFNVNSGENEGDPVHIGFLADIYLEANK